MTMIHLKGALNSHIIVGQNNFLEPTTILIMRINANHINSQFTLES